ncbi:MAG: hypothetical protein WBO45_16885 [Planctomycetota bacterium]
MLLDEIERARDALLLPPRDPAADLYDHLLDRHMAEAGSRASAAAIGELATSLAEKQRALEAAQRQAAALQQRIDAATRRVAQLEQAAATTIAPDAGPVPAPGRVSPGHDHELIRLRNRVTELKGLVTENLTRRKELERQLTAPSREIATVGLVPATVAVEAADPDPEPADADALAPRAVCIPVFDEAAASVLRQLDRPLAARILRAVGLVAAADHAAWRAVKTLRAAPGRLRLRVGHHRLLMRVDEERRQLTVMQIVQRRELDEAVRRLTR